MKQSLFRMWFACWFLAAPSGGMLSAQDSDSEEAIHDELRTMRDEATAALNKLDIDRLLEFVHPDVVFIASHPDVGREVQRGHEGVRAYFDKMFTGPNRRAKSMTTEITVDESALIYGGDTAIAWGSTRDTYTMLDDSKFTVNTRWSGTLVKEGDRWLIAEFHVSVNMFNNPLLAPAMRYAAWTAGSIGLCGGLVLGVLLSVGAMLITRRKKLTSGEES